MFPGSIYFTAVISLFPGSKYFTAVISAFPGSIYFTAVILLFPGSIIIHVFHCCDMHICREERETFIKAKYIEHKYTIIECSDQRELQTEFVNAIQQRDLQSIIQVYAEGLELMTVLPDSVSVTGYSWWWYLL